MPSLEFPFSLSCCFNSRDRFFFSPPHQSFDGGHNNSSLVCFSVRKHLCTVDIHQALFGFSWQNDLSFLPRDSERVASEGQCIITLLVTAFYIPSVLGVW